MKKRTYILGAVAIIVALLIAGTLDYQEARDTSTYWTQQTK